MTVRPRYTARMKAHDLIVGYGNLFRAVSPVLKAPIVALAQGTRQTLATRYTDPRSPR